MVNVTWPSGQVIAIDASDFVRIRRAYASYDGPNGNTHVDWIQPDLVMEEASALAGLVSAERVAQNLLALARLTLPGGDPVWFNGTKAVGPLYIGPTNRFGGVNSSLQIGGKLQLVAETPQQVAEVVAAAGGKVIPIREDSAVTTMKADAVFRLEIWDADLVETKGAAESMQFDNPFGIHDFQAKQLDSGPGSTNGPKGPQ